VCRQGEKIAEFPPPLHTQNRQRTVKTVNAHSKP
jgi:hypothetical protein